MLRFTAVHMTLGACLCLCVCALFAEIVGFVLLLRRIEVLCIPFFMFHSLLAATALMTLQVHQAPQNGDPHRDRVLHKRV